MKMELEHTDLAQLPESILTALLNLIPRNPETTGVEPASPTYQSPGRRPVDLDAAAISLFLSGVGDRTWKGLELFVENKGRISIAKIEEVGLNPAGFAAALTKRVRTTLTDKHAFFMDWDWGTHEYFITATTLRSLTEALSQSK